MGLGGVIELGRILLWGRWCSHGRGQLGINSITAFKHVYDIDDFAYDRLWYEYHVKDNTVAANGVVYAYIKVVIIACGLSYSGARRAISGAYYIGNNSLDQPFMVYTSGAWLWASVPPCPIPSPHFPPRGRFVPLPSALHVVS